jgi:hypothetical protein
MGVTLSASRRVSAEAFARILRLALSMTSCFISDSQPHCWCPHQQLQSSNLHKTPLEFKADHIIADKFGICANGIIINEFIGQLQLYHII